MVILETVKSFTKLSQDKQNDLITKFATEKGFACNPKKMFLHFPEFFKWLTVNINSVESEKESDKNEVE